MEPRAHWIRSSHKQSSVIRCSQSQSVTIREKSEAVKHNHNQSINSRTPVIKQQVLPLRTKLPETILKPKDVTIPFSVVMKQDSGKPADKPSKARA